MANFLPSQSGKTTYRVNGVEYRNINEVPAEYRALVAEIEKNPPKDSQITVTKQLYAFPTLPEKAQEPNRKKFLEEMVLPNLHLMDEKTKGEFFKELYKTPAAPKGLFSRLHPLFWVALGVGIPIGLAILFDVDCYERKSRVARAQVDQSIFPGLAPCDFVS
jgi:hypothetical protein